MLMVSLHGESIPVREADTGKTVWFGGQANLLSKETIDQPLIDSIHFATKQRSSGNSGAYFAQPAATGSGEIELRSPASSTRSFGEVARIRRSALDFLGGMKSMSLAELSAILACTAQPLLADFAGTRFIQLYLYVHRVEGLLPGVYRFWPERAELERVLNRGAEKSVIHHHHGPVRMPRRRSRRPRVHPGEAAAQVEPLRVGGMLQYRPCRAMTVRHRAATAGRGRAGPPAGAGSARAQLRLCPLVVGAPPQPVLEKVGMKR